MLTSLLRIEQLLKCELCDGLLARAHTLSECGHRFCYDCVYEKLGREGQCPSCRLPAIVKNLRRDPMHDTLVACVDKLKRKLLTSTLTPLTGTPDIPLSHDPNHLSLDQDTRCSYHGQQITLATDLGDISSKTVPIKAEDVIEFDFDDLWLQQEQPIGTLDREGYESIGEIDVLSRNESEDQESQPCKAVQKRQKLCENSDDDGQNRMATVDRVNSIDMLNWQCVHCLYTNTPLQLMCGICRSSRNSAAMSESRETVCEPETFNGSSLEPSLSELTLMTSLSYEEEVSPSVNVVHIMYTGITDTDRAEIERFMMHVVHTGLKIHIYSHLRDIADITHLLTSVDERKLSGRTSKYLHGILAGKWILDVTWLTSSIRAGRWLQEEPFEVQGDTTTGTTHGPHQGRLRAAKNADPLFKDMRFYFRGDFSEKYNKNDLVQLCIAAGARVLGRRPGNQCNHKVKTPCLDTSCPIAIVPTLNYKKNMPSWIHKVRDVAWMIECISKSTPPYPTMT